MPNTNVRPSPGTGLQDMRLLGGALSTNTTAFGTIPGKADSLTPPNTSLATGRLIIERQAGLVDVLKFVGKGADNATFSVRAWSWHRIPAVESGDQSLAVQSWHAVPRLTTTTITLSSKVGIAGALIDENTRYADTIGTITERAAAPMYTRAVQPAVADNGSVDLILGDCLGAEKWEIEVTADGGTATSMGVLHTPLPAFEAAGL